MPEKNGPLQFKYDQKEIVIFLVQNLNKCWKEIENFQQFCDKLPTIYKIVGWGGLTVNEWTAYQRQREKIL
jgi:hypothetical protein